MKKWLDNYNDASVSTGPGFVGEGYDTKGRNYSPAWGGQFQWGGFLQPNDIRLPSAVAPPNQGDILSSELARSIGGEGGEPAYLVPSFKGGRRVNEKEEFRKTGEHLGGPFKTWEEAEKFGEMRHQYVEKGQSLPSPLKWWGEMQMGGSIPGSVGFTYARTQGAAPDNGKYAKKTKASAQNGIVVNDPNDPRLKKYQDSLTAYNKSNNLYKQLLKQGKEGNEGIREQVKDKMSLKEVNYRGSVGMPYSFEGIKPDYVLGTRTPKENRGYLPHYKQPTQPVKYEAPKAEVKTVKGTKRLFINDTEVDEATFNRIVPKKESMQNGGEMKFYQEGLDWKPKSISKNGKWLDNYSEPIKDDRGQWAHPGEVTEINSNEITMEGVDYPVLGISDTGDTKMMKPGKNYKFKGKKVTEYPMAQGGKKLKGKPTVKEIMEMPMPVEKKYEPTQEVKNLKATLSGIDLSTLPAIETPWGFIVNRTAAIANSVGDAYTAARYAIDGQWDNAAIDAGEALLDLIPFAKGKRVINLSKRSNLPGVYNKLSKVDKSFNRGLGVLKAGAYGDDFQDIVPESYKYKKQKGGWLNKYK